MYNYRQIPFQRPLSINNTIFCWFAGGFSKDPPAGQNGEYHSYHGAGTCTFYGTANSNQMMMEVMGLHVPGSAFVNPGTRLRTELTRAATHRITQIGKGKDYRPLGQCIDEKAIVNACIGLLATGGSTNHTLHIYKLTCQGSNASTSPSVFALGNSLNTFFRYA